MICGSDSLVYVCLWYSICGDMAFDLYDGQKENLLVSELTEAKFSLKAFKIHLYTAGKRHFSSSYY